MNGRNDLHFNLVFFLLTLPSTLISAQVLFPGNSPDRRSRTYDVIHYKIVASFDEVEKKVAGTTSITLTPLVAALDSVVFDAEGMEVQLVLLARGSMLRFANRSPHLVVFFDARCNLGDTLTIAVTYSCKPKAGLYFVQPDSADPKRRQQIWSQGEDTNNHFWFPCYDYPNDKATSEVIATVPESYMLLSNGKLLSTKHDMKKKSRTFHWFESKPHSSYLIMITAGEYERVQERYRSLPIEYYVYKDRVQDGIRSLAQTPSVMKFFEEKIGVPYPWEKYAQIWISNFMWGGMENASAVTLNDESYLLDPRAAIDFSSDDVVAHELAHQWWGDLVTSRDWNNLWLHEGFANYFEALFKQHQKGEDYFQHDLMQQALSVINTEDAHGRPSLVGKDGYTANIYSKGCWVLHMLRSILGEQEFWNAIRYYAQRFSFRNVDSHEFMLAVEDATGKNLGWFFEQWVYKGGHPKVLVTSTWGDDAKMLDLEMTQTQVLDSLTGVFRFPLSIECTTASGVRTMTVSMEKQSEKVSIPLPDRPLMVIVDRGKNVLATFEWKKTKEEYIFQLVHAGDIVDRIEAAKQLQEHNEDTTAAQALRSSALHDGFWAVRNQAVLALAASNVLSVKDILFEVYKDKHSSVRATAITSLSRFASPDVSEFVQKAADNDSSLLVLSSCIRTLSEIDSARGFNLAAKCVGMDSYRNIIRRAALRAMLSLKDVRAIPFALTYCSITNPNDIRTQAVRLLGEMGGNNPRARERLTALVNDGISVIRKTAVESIGAWGGAEAREILVRRQGIENDESVKTAIGQALESLSGGSAPDSSQGK